MTTIKKLRNLHQYKNLSDEELEKVLYDIEHPKEKLISEKMKEFEKDYDLTDMTVNDLMALEELAKIYLRLEYLDNKLDEGIENNINEFEKITKVASQLRSDASDIQRDLDITRKARASSGANSVVDVVDDILTRAGKFVEDRLITVFCPKCNLLVAKYWLLDSNTPYVLQFICPRESCGYKFTVKNSDIINLKNKEVGPKL